MHEVLLPTLRATPCRRKLPSEICRINSPTMDNICNQIVIISATKNLASTKFVAFKHPSKVRMQTRG